MFLLLPFHSQAVCHCTIIISPPPSPVYSEFGQTQRPYRQTPLKQTTCLSHSLELFWSGMPSDRVSSQTPALVPRALDTMKGQPIPLIIIFHLFAAGFPCFTHGVHASVVRMQYECLTRPRGGGEWYRANSAPDAPRWAVVSMCIWLIFGSDGVTSRRFTLSHQSPNTHQGMPPSSNNPRPWTYKREVGVNAFQSSL